MSGMKKILFTVTFLLLVNVFLCADIIEKIIVEGNKKVSRDTVLFYMKTAEKAVYSPEKLREDFKSLWKTGFFENISIESEDTAGGKIIKIIVKENKLIKSIKYKSGKKVKEKDIVEKLQENNISLLAFSYYSPAKLKRVERIIQGMLQEKGYNDGSVQFETKETGDQVDLTINVNQGARTKIGNIVFPGLKKGDLGPGFLRRGMKNNKAHGFLSAIGGKDVYNREKINEDLEEVKLRLQQKGYLEAKVGKPEFTKFRKHTLFGKIQSMMRISIPVDPGPRYRVGDIKIEGNKIIRTDHLYSLVKLEKGKLFNIKKRNKTIELIQKVYGSLGYIYCQVAPLENMDPVKKIADLTLRLNEGEVAYLGKLEFKGNTFTKDHVIRREWFLREGERLNINMLEGCLTRMKQLGIVTVEQMPEIRPNPQDPTKVDIIAEVKEVNRQMINFNVGYSGYDGWFIALGYSTQNFMGMGETFSVNLQSGTRSKNYTLSFTEPYMFNLPASLGISVHKTTLNIPYLYTRKGQGFGISTSWRFLRYMGASISYNFEDIEISDVNESLNIWDNPYYQYYYGEEGKRTISSITPTIYYSTVDSPIFPRSGTKYLFNYRFSGGPLGGSIDLHKGKMQFVKFIPLWKRTHTFGMQVVYQFLKGFGDNPVPFYEKFFLGGEQFIRGFDIYRIGPKNDEGVVLGGSKSFFVNLEYQIPINDQLSFNFFYDVGNAYDFGQGIDFNDVYSSMGAEIKIFMPMLNVPFRLIFSYNPRKIREEDSNFVFRFAVGPSFN